MKSLREKSITLQDIDAMDIETLTPEQIAPIIGFHPQSIRIQARDDPSELGFPVIRAGTRVRIPRRAFLAFMKGQIFDATYIANK